jgi:hypothetical protein
MVFFAWDLVWDLLEQVIFINGNRLRVD